MVDIKGSQIPISDNTQPGDVLMGVRKTAGGNTNFNLSVTALLNATNGAFMGAAEADTNPGVPSSARYYQGKPGVTYTYFKDASNASIVIPKEVNGQYVVDVRLIWNGTSWSATWGLMDVPDPKIKEWTASAYLIGSQVFYNGNIYESNVATLATDVPDSSTKWDRRISTSSSGLFLDNNFSNSQLKIANRIISFSFYTTDKNIVDLTLQRYSNAANSPLAIIYAWNAAGEKIAEYNVNSNNLVSQTGNIGRYRVDSTSWSLAIEMVIPDAGLFGTSARSPFVFNLSLLKLREEVALENSKQALSLFYSPTPVNITWKEGYRNINGTIGASTDWRYSDPIPVQPGAVYFINAAASDVAQAVTAVSESGDYIRELMRGAAPIIARIYAITIPSDITYISTTSRLAFVPVAFVSKGSDLFQSLLGGQIRYATKDTVGAFIGSSGESNVSGGWRSSGFEAITPGAVYRLKAKLGGVGVTVYPVAFYADKSEVTFSGGKQVPAGSPAQTIDELITAPANARYYKTCSDPNGFSYLQSTLEQYMADTRLGVLQALQGAASPFAVPAFIDCPIGRNTDIFLDGISSDPDTHAIGSVIPKSATAAIINRGSGILRYNPGAKAGNISVSFNKTDNQLNTLFSATTQFRSVERNTGNGASKNICIGGDSLVDNLHLATEVYNLLAQDGDYAITQIGTRGPAGGKHEGRGGWSWALYNNPAYETTPLNGVTNAFLKNGVLDFINYMNVNFPALANRNIDIFGMMLGTNDVGQGLTPVRSLQIDQVIVNAKIFINAFFAAFPNSKFIVGLPGVGAPSFPAADYDPQNFRKNIQTLNRRYISEFDNGKYHPNLTTVMHGAYIDRIASFPYVDEPVNDYSPTMVRAYTDRVHPKDIGYKQWGRGVYGKVRAVLSGYL